MSRSAADALLHPVRLRVVRALASRRDATVTDLAADLPDVPPASLYRHVKRLASAGVIVVVSERPVRGATESRYQLARGVLRDEDLATATRDDHLRYFATFLATLIDDFGAYLDRGTPDYAGDGVGYRQLPLHLTDAEFRRMAAALSATLIPFLKLAPSPKRKLRFFSTIVMPAAPRNAA